MRYISYYITWKIYVDLEYIQLEYFVQSSNIQSVLNAKNGNHTNKLSGNHGPLYLVLNSYQIGTNKKLIILDSEEKTIFMILKHVYS